MTGDVGPECLPGGVALTRFDSDSKTFQPLDVVGEFGQRNPYVDLLGVVGDSIILRIDGSLYSLPEDGGRLTDLGAPPIDAGVTLACLVGDKILAIVQTFPGDMTLEPGELSEEEFQPFVPFEAAIYDLASGRWTRAGGPSATYDTTDTFDYGCAAPGAIAVPSERPMLESSPYVTFLFDVTAAAWVEAPPPPREFLAAGAVAWDGTRLVLSVSGDVGGTDNAVLAFDSASGSWTDEEGGEGLDASAIAIAGDRVVSLSSDAETVLVAEGL